MARAGPARAQPFPAPIAAAASRSFGPAARVDSPLRAAERRSHDDIYIGNLEETWLAVTNPRLGLTFRLEWEPAELAWVILWQAYGGADAPPLTGSYALGVEPWTSRLNLENAVASGEAIELAPGDRFATRFSAGVTRAPSASG